ncbi:hypothetical protein DPMN_107204 [Dreissena polymorpha]|uniref:VWFA domain-containing protein n=1 Tax=Dreissena polymorpha TaxID=45954 RepID=A0A9D4K6B1_DREPO|nr:hypothetical protein DPMN_107204 [Dreissena polymorpha]
MHWLKNVLQIFIVILRVAGDSVDLSSLHYENGGFDSSQLFRHYNFPKVQTITDLIQDKSFLSHQHKVSPLVPPLSSSKYLTMPQLPVNMVGFPSNHTFAGPNVLPVPHSMHKPGSHFDPHFNAYISLPPGSPAQVITAPHWMSISPSAPSALGIAFQRVEPSAHALLPKADPVHLLPINHLFVPVGVRGIESTDAKGIVQHGGPPVADILIVIDASHNMGHIDAQGVVVWNPHIVDFIRKFIESTSMGSKDHRIGIVVVSYGIDDMIPLTHDKPLLIDALHHLRPLFRGGCTEKGISTASSLFYQYGRPFAVKRIVLLTDGAQKCSYRTMPEVLYAQKCGIDIIHIGFGSDPDSLTDIGIVPDMQRSMWFVQGPDMLSKLVDPVSKRAFIAPMHGGWSAWSDWNMCSADGTCSIGYQMRFRLCDGPRPAFGGRNCEGFPAETRMCHLTPCIDVYAGYWTRWTEYTPCSSACGPGLRTRQRTCITLNGHPSGSCRGSYVERIDCVEQACPTDGSWSGWSTWSRCSLTCGTGLKMRARQCDSPPPGNGGKFCLGQAVEETVCDTTLPCPIHGGFTVWSDWSTCDGLCGIGRHRRVRKCENPMAQYGGNRCIGDTDMIEPCDTGLPCPVHGQWGNWPPYSKCSATCGKGINQRSRVCDNPPPQYGGEICIGQDVEEVPCDSGVPCPIHGGWSGWTEFMQCSVQCGIGLMQRKRVCDNPLPIYGGLDCIGATIETMECDTTIPCPVDGHWGPWSPFSSCSVDCGIGIQGRERLCDSPPPKNGGAMCVGLSHEDRQCDSGKPCAINGFWSHWNPWGDCSAACSVGFRQRIRQCNNPTPLNEGMSCEGSPIEEVPCDTGVPCPQDGGWSIWSASLPCSAHCGLGTSKRVRTCDAPTPMHGGKICFGPDIEI